MKLPGRLLDPAVWRGLEVNTLYWSYEDGDVLPKNPNHADSVYHPPSSIPAFLLVRVSASTKRLENGLEGKSRLSGSWGSVIDVVGSGSTIGVAFAVPVKDYARAHCTPDGANLLSAELQDIDGEDFPVVKPIYEYKTFRAFRIGPQGNDAAPHDLMVTAKKRWFRKRNNPKFLGFSKDDKV